MLRPPLRVELVGNSDRGPRFLAYVSDLSSEGAFMQSANPRTVGTRLMVKIHPARGGRRPLYAEVEVRWTRPYVGRAGPGPGMGVEFLHLRRSDRRLLSRWLVRAKAG